MRPLTLVLPFYENPGMLAEQQMAWSAYPAELGKALHVIVVDDGSPTRPAFPAWAPPATIGSARLYRTLVDVRWNWLFCRNLGVSEAATDWVLLTDIDHVMPEASLRRILCGPLNDKAVYRFSRVSAPALDPYKPHPNTWLLTRSMFEAIGGYDERFSGWYGTDADFRERVQATADAVVMLPDVLIRYPREVIPDASTTTYLRKTEEDGANVRKIREDRSRELGWKTQRVTFPYERVA